MTAEELPDLWTFWSYTKIKVGHATFMEMERPVYHLANIQVVRGTSSGHLTLTIVAHRPPLWVT
jgi:hypothetical protein